MTAPELSPAERAEVERPEAGPDGLADEGWCRVRFNADYPDWQPIYDAADGRPADLGPYWCTGYGDDYSVIVAYVRPGRDVADWWPEAQDVEVGEVVAEPLFTDRFPRPEWWRP